MKIRTDFVTNSSSYSSAEVLVDNPILLKILSKYVEKDVFGEAERVEREIPEKLDFKIGTRVRKKRFIGATKKPAFLYDYDSAAIERHPYSLDDVLMDIIAIMDNDYLYEVYNKKLYNQMKEELLQRKDEINASYLQVIWFGNSDGFGHEEPEEGEEIEWLYLYKPEDGEQLSIKYYKPEEHQFGY